MKVSRSLRMSSLTPISSSSGAKSATKDNDHIYKRTLAGKKANEDKMDHSYSETKQDKSIGSLKVGLGALTVALLADFVQNTEELWR